MQLRDFLIKAWRPVVGKMRFIFSVLSMRFVDAEGITSTWCYFDTIHLSQRAIPMALNALRGIFPWWVMRKLEVMVPSQMDRFVDRVTKRIRRLTRVQSPVKMSQL